MSAPSNDILAVDPVVISYKDLTQKDLSPLYPHVTKAFGSGPECLGLIIVKDLPEEYRQLRENALRASARFANLPQCVKEKYTDPESSFNFGWSHGKEIMNGVPDNFKGSYYANPTCDHTTATPEQISKHPGYLRSNIWPTEEDCPSFQMNFKDLAGFMVQVGCLLARACDDLVARYSSVTSIEGLIQSSHCSKARLLHYYPPSTQTVDLDQQSTSQGTVSTGSSESNKQDSWCGDHLDHSLLTALCPALYLFHPTTTDSEHHKLDPLAVPSPTSSAGLYIRTRAGQEVKAKIPTNCLAFQTGEALQLLTRNQLQATPHYVAAGAEGEILPTVYNAIESKKREDGTWSGVTKGVISRETMAVFLQPDVDAIIGPQGETFGQFAQRIFESHYEASG